MRCALCGARNSDDATWCTQCYADVRDQRDPDAPGLGDHPEADDGSAPSPTAEGPAPLADAGADADAASVDPSGASEDAAQPVPGGARSDTGGGARDVRERDGEVEWRCAACDGWSPLTSSTCVVCGSPRSGFGEAAQPAAPADLSDAGILGASLLLPGLGHVLAGRPGTGLARAILAVLWLFGGIALVVGNPGILSLPGWVLLVSAVVLWVTTALDARALAAGDPEVLTTRRLAGLVLAVTVGVVVAASVVLVGGR